MEKSAKFRWQKICSLVLSLTHLFLFFGVSLSLICILGKDNDAKKATDIAAAEIINDVSSRDEKRKGDSSGDICHFPFFE